MFQSRLTRFVLFLCAVTLAHADDHELKNLNNDAEKATKGAKETVKGANDVANGNVEKGLQTMDNGAQETVNGAKNGMNTVSGNMQMNVGKSRRLQSSPIGFAQDSGAKTAVKQAIATKAKTTADKVHAQQSEASSRRLAAGDPSGVVTVDYSVDCGDSLTCFQMYTLLHVVAEEDWTAEILADLEEDSPYTVKVTRHLVDMVPCAVYGKGYNDPQANNTPTGAFVGTAATCQNLCHLSASCKYFTWYKDTSACWLQGNTSDLEVASDNAIAGPSLCPATKNREAVVQEWVMGDANLGTNLATNRSAAPTWGLLLGFITMVSALAFVCAGRRNQKTSMTASPERLDEEMVADPAQE